MPFPNSLKYAAYAAIALSAIRSTARKAMSVPATKSASFDPVDLFLHVGYKKACFASCDSRRTARRLIEALTPEFDAVIPEFQRRHRGMRYFISVEPDINDNPGDFNRNGVRYSRIYQPVFGPDLDIESVLRINRAIERAANR